MKQTTADQAAPGYYWVRSGEDAPGWWVLCLDKNGVWWDRDLPLLLSGPEGDDPVWGPILPPEGGAA